LTNKNTKKFEHFLTVSFHPGVDQRFFCAVLDLTFLKQKQWANDDDVNQYIHSMQTKKIPLFFLMCSPAIASKSTSIGKNWFLKVAGFRLWTIFY